MDSMAAASTQRLPRVPLPCLCRDEVEEKLEEQEPGRKHLSGFYVQRGHDVMAGGKRRPQRIVLVGGAPACGTPRLRGTSPEAPVGLRQELEECGSVAQQHQHQAGLAR